jgi:uncharacterized membrane protein
MQSSTPSSNKGPIVAGVAALAGMALSGYLSYLNFFTATCTRSWVSCAVNGKKVLLLGLPTCVYGFFFFGLSLALIGAAAQTKSKKLVDWLLGVATVGVLFSATLIVYESIWLKAFKYGFPACVYGFIFYSIIWIVAFGWRKKFATSTQSTPTI